MVAETVGVRMPLRLAEVAVARVVGVAEVAEIKLVGQVVLRRRDINKDREVQGKITLEISAPNKALVEPLEVSRAA